MKSRHQKAIVYLVVASADVTGFLFKIQHILMRINTVPMLIWNLHRNNFYNRKEVNIHIFKLKGWLRISTAPLMPPLSLLKGVIEEALKETSKKLNIENSFRDELI